MFIDNRPVEPSETGKDKDSLRRLEECIESVRKWMVCNKLKLNDNKTEFMVFGSKASLKKVTKSIMIGNNDIHSVESVCNIGAFFDSTLCMKEHIKQISK